MKKYKVNILVSLITSFITCMVFFPVTVTGGFYSKTYLAYMNFLNYIGINDNDIICRDCSHFEVNLLLLIIEFILVFIIVFFILKFVDRRRKK